MTKAEKSVRTQAQMEPCEARRLLAFSPAGAPVLVDAGGVTGVEAMAGLTDGRYVVAWQEGTDVYVRLFNADDSPVAAAQKVNTSANAANPDVAITGDGTFVVVWEEADTELSGIYQRRFLGTGVPEADPTLVNTTETGVQDNPSVAIATNGTYTVVWQSADSDLLNPRILGQRYDAAGAAAGPELLVSANEDSTAPDIGMAGAGASVVVWNNATHTLAQRFDAAGDPAGGVITVDNETASTPSVGVATDGSFVVGWSVDEDGAGAGVARNVLYQRYSSGGSTLGGQGNAASSPAGDEAFPQVDVAGSGKFTIGWAEAGVTPGTYDRIGFRAFADDGASLGDDAFVTGVGFSSQTQFGVIWRDFQPMRVAYQTGANASVQSFTSELVINANNNGQVIQVFGSPGNYVVRIDGATTNYDPDLFTGIVINGGAGNDYVRGKNVALPMTVIGGPGNDTIITAEGNDYVEGNLGNDAINLGDGDDYAIGNDENDTIYGGTGNDFLNGRLGRNLIYGEAGDDVIYGGKLPDTLFGGPGNDRIDGQAHGDALFGEDGNDTLIGGDGNDGLVGGAGNDILSAGRGNDTLRGGDGNDSLNAGADLDYLFGDAGFDILDGGTEGDFGYTDGLDQLFNIEIRRSQ